MQTLEGKVLELLVETQKIIDEVPVSKEARIKLEMASDKLDTILDILQPREVSVEDFFINRECDEEGCVVCNG